MGVVGEIASRQYSLLLLSTTRNSWIRVLADIMAKMAEGQPEMLTRLDRLVDEIAALHSKLILLGRTRVSATATSST